MTSTPDRSSGVARPQLRAGTRREGYKPLAVPFDIDEFIRMCSGGGRLDAYFDAIRKADDEALESFRKEVISHKRRQQKERYAAQRTPQGLYRFSPHDEYLLKAIWWEQTIRSKPRLWIYKKLLPVRRAWLFFWRGMELKDNEYLGYVAVGREEDYGIIPYTGVRMALIHAAREIGRYFVRNHWKIITAAISIAAIYVTWQVGR